MWRTSQPLGYQQITDLDPAVGLTVPASSNFALLSCEGADIRWRDDGTDPTSTVGHLLAEGDYLLYDGHLTAIKFFETSTASVLNVTYYA